MKTIHLTIVKDHAGELMSKVYLKTLYHFFAIETVSKSEPWHLFQLSYWL